MDPDELAAAIVADVEAALAEADPHGALEMLVADVFSLVMSDTGGRRDDTTMADEVFVDHMTAAIDNTVPDGTGEQAERVARVIALAAINAAAVAQASPGSRVTWRTMRDDRVRDTHRPLEGETRDLGDPFVVGGVAMLYPGQPVGPPEGWINCRCHLSVEPMMAAVTAASDKPWGQFSASDYTIEQWRRACLLKMPGGDPESKSTYKLPVREPGGALNRNGVHAAAAALGGARGGVSAPPAAVASAKAKLRRLYAQMNEEPPDSLKADAESQETLVGWAPSTSPPGTHDAPGWLTHPRETERLRVYWTKGEGAAKIRWGTPGDLTRCHKHLSKYIPPPFTWGTCQNLHKVALGYWNPQSKGRRGGGEPDAIIDSIDAAFTAAGDDMDITLPPRPREWYEDPHLDGPTPLTVTSDGRVVGHLATWGMCHVGISDDCVMAPHSEHDYAYFRTGEVETADGSLVTVGQITMDTGHAGREMGPNETVHHYDDTGTAVADVAAGEDEYGIWIAGAMRPGISEQQMYVLKATGALSGDWRRIGGNLELVATLAVNVPGFPIPRVEMAASALDERVLSLTAAAIVTVDPNAAEAERIAIAVVDRMAARDARAARTATLTAAIRHLRAAELTRLGS